MNEIRWSEQKIEENVLKTRVSLPGIVQRDSTKHISSPSRLRNDYFGRPNVSESSFIWASLIPSGSKPIFFDAIYIRAALLSTST